MKAQEARSESKKVQESIAVECYDYIQDVVQDASNAGTSQYTFVRHNFDEDDGEISKAFKNREVMALVCSMLEDDGYSCSITWDEPYYQPIALRVSWRDISIDDIVSGDDTNIDDIENNPDEYLES